MARLLRAGVSNERIFLEVREEKTKVQKKFLAGVCALALAAIAAGCSQNSASSDVSNNNVSTSATGDATASATIPGPDNTEIATVTSNGVTTETRTFKDPNSRVEKVVVTTRDGKRTARVYYRDKTERDMDDNEVGNALSATGDALVKAGSVVADKTGDAAHAVGDKTEDAADATAKGAKKVGSVVGDTAEDAGSATVHGAKKVGSTVGDKTEDAADATAHGAKKAGKATAHGAKKVGKAVKNAITP